MYPVFFYLFAAVLVIASLNVVMSRNPLYNVLSLVVAIFSLSCLFIMLEAFFVGMILILVYAGAVLVFFLFIVMCLNLNTMNLNVGQQGYLKWLGIAIGAIFLTLIGLMLKSFSQAMISSPSSLRGTIEAVGQILFTNYLLPFELTSLLLLIAIFGIVSLAQGVLSTGKDIQAS